jgi:hypothetical protein
MENAGKENPLRMLLKVLLDQQKELARLREELHSVVIFLAAQNRIEPSLLLSQFRKAAEQRLATLPADSAPHALQAMIDILDLGKDLNIHDS